VTPTSISLELLGGPVLALLALAAVLLVLSLRLYGAPRFPLLALRLASVALVVLLLMEPVLAFFAERRAPPRIVLLADASLSMTIPFPEEGGEGTGAVPTRAERMAEALEETKLLEALADEGRVDAYRFGGSVEPLPGEDGEMDLAPREDRTDLAGALADGVGALRSRTGAVVLLSDGSRNVGADPRAEARRLAVPVYTVGVGSAGPVADLSVFDVIASGVSYLDNVVPVEAKIRARGDAAPGVVVYLSEGDAVMDSARVDLPGGGIEAGVDLKYVPHEEGLHVYRVWTRPQEGEISAANNEHLFAVRVLREKIRVLLAASRPTFDLTFLKRALEADVSLQVESTVQSLGAFEGALGRRGKAFPARYADLARYDLVVLSDMGAADLGAAHAANLARFVGERGGALLVTGSARAFELAGSPLAELVPFVAEPASRPRRGQILPRLTQSGRTHPVTTLTDEEAANARLWSELPPLAEAPVFFRRRPEARALVLGELDGVAREEMPLVTTLETGRGRVLAIAGGPYWRWDLYLWGTGRPGDAFRHLVSRSVRWLVARDELKQVLVRPGKSLFDGAETVIIEGQVYDDDFRPIEGADVRATVLGPLGTEEERAREISLPDVGGGRYRGSLPGLPPGDYRVDGTASVGGAALGEDRSEMTVAPYRLEFEDPAPDFAMLQQISQESGGRFLTLPELGELPDLLDLEPVVEHSVKEWPFQEQPLVFLALLALLGGEWALRRGRGLP
jgi:hypothetical protein